MGFGWEKLGEVVLNAFTTLASGFRNNLGRPHFLHAGHARMPETLRNRGLRCGCGTESTYMSAIFIRPASPEDASAIWSIIQPIIRAGETYTLDRDMSETTHWLLVSSEKRYLLPKKTGHSRHLLHASQPRW